MRYSFEAGAIELAFTKCALDLESSRLSRTLLVGKTLPDSILIMGQQLANLDSDYIISKSAHCQT
jgi:hypothetical protein